MPIHFKDLDVVSKIDGPCSVLIIPCYMCPAVAVSTRDKKPFLEFMSHLLKSQPFEEHIKGLQSALSKRGIETKVFKSHFIHQWFVCMWTAGRRRKLKQELDKYDSAIVLGCDSAIETVQDLVGETDLKVMPGMEVVGFMNAKLKFSLPCNISFEDCRVVPFSEEKTGKSMS